MSTPSDPIAVTTTSNNSKISTTNNGVLPESSDAITRGSSSTKVEATSKSEVSTKAGAVRQPSPLVTSNSSESLQTSAKSSKSADSKSLSSVSIATTPSHGSGTGSASATSIAPSTSKSHLATKKRKDTPSDGPLSPKSENASSASYVILPDSIRAMSPPKDLKRKSAKNTSASTGQLSIDVSSTQRDSTLPSSTQNSSQSPLLSSHPGSTATELTTGPAGSNLIPFTSSAAVDDPPKKKSGAKKRKSIKELLPGHIAESDRDQSPLWRGESSLPSTDPPVSPTSLSSIQSHASATVHSTTDGEPSSEVHVPAGPKIRKSTSSTFKESLVSMITSPIKKKKTKGEESDGERDDKIISREPKENADSKDSVTFKDSKDKEPKDLKEKDKEKEAKEGKESKETEKAKDSKSGKDKESKEKDKDKDGKDGKDGKDSKEKDAKEAKDKEFGSKSSPNLPEIHHPLPTTPYTGITGHASPSLAHLSLTSNSSSSSPVSPSLTVSFAKKPKKVKKKVVGSSASKRKSKVCLLQTIPVEVLLKVLCCLDVPSLMHIGSTSKLFKGICKEPFVWHVVAVKMMRAGQRKPRVFEWQSYCKNIWCFRRGISLDAELSAEYPFSQEMLDLVNSANKRLAKDSVVISSPKRASSSSQALSAIPLPPSNGTNGHSSDSSLSIPPTTTVPAEDHESDATSLREHASAELTNNGDLGTATAARSSPPSNGHPTQLSTLEDGNNHRTEDNSELTHSTASIDVISTSEDDPVHSGSVGGAATPSTPLSSRALSPSFTTSMSAYDSIQAAVPASLDVFAGHLLSIIRTSPLDLQTDLSLSYPFLFTEDDGLELRLCVAMPTLFKVKHTLASTPHLVLRANHLPTREMVAIVKVPYVPGMRPLLKSQDLQLTRFLRSVDCPYLVGYYGCYFDGRHIWHISEHCSGGSCRQHLDETRYSAFNETEMAWMARDVLRALVVLHKHGYIHGNISASALMLTELRQGRSMVKLRVKTLLSALEASRHLSSGQLARKAYWRAPESVIAPPMDVWSIGITFMELAEGRPPGWNLPPQKARNAIVNGPPPSLRYPTSFSPKFRSFLDSCLAKDPNNRPSALQLLSHPFIIDNVSIASMAKKGSNQAGNSRPKITRFNSSPIAASSSIVSAKAANSSTSNNTANTRLGETTRRRKDNAKATSSNPDSTTPNATRRPRNKKSKNTDATAKANSSVVAVARPRKITRRLSYAGSASTSDTMTHPYLSDSEDNISFALTHSSSRLSFSWSEDWASGSVDVSMDSKH